jgi:ammonia channel protein AmtB
MLCLYLHHLKLVHTVVPLRVPTETELEGLDVPEFGMTAYPEDALAEAK